MRDFKNYYIITASPEEVYLALTNPNTIHLWTGEPAEMVPLPGTEFSLWDGSITGRNIEFIENKLIIQQWYFGEQKEESIVTIKLHPHKNGTSAEVKHVNIPDDAYADISEGWNENYFASLIEFYDE